MILGCPNSATPNKSLATFLATVAVGGFQHIRQMLYAINAIIHPQVIQSIWEPVNTCD